MDCEGGNDGETELKEGEGADERAGFMKRAMFSMTRMERSEAYLPYTSEMGYDIHG